MEPQPMDVDATGPYLSGYSTPPELQQDMEFVMEDVAYLVNESEQRSKNEKKIARLLNSRSVELNGDILDILTKDGNMQIAMSHVSRLDYKNTPGQLLEDCSLKERVVHARHPRNERGVTAIKRSFNVMTIIEDMTMSEEFAYYVYAVFDDIVNGVLLSLQPNSHAYLAHVFKIMLLMIQFDCCSMLDRLIMTCNGSNLWNLMLPYLANIGMADVITALLFPPPNKRDVSSQTSDETIYKRVQCHIYLKSLGFIERLFELMRLEEDQDYVANVIKFFISLVKEHAKYSSEHHLLEPLEGPHAGKFFNILLTIAEGDAFNRDIVMDALKVLVTSATVRRNTVMVPLHTLAGNSKLMLVPYIERMVGILLANREVDYDQKTYIKLVNSSLLEAIYEVIASSEPGMGALDGLSPAFWKLLVRSFLKFIKHNHFHVIFFKFFFAVVDRKHERTLRVFIRKTGLITSMIDLYENRDSQISNRGFILLMLNQLRLASDAEPEGEIAQMVNNNHKFIAFLPTLRKDTKAWITPATPWSQDLPQRPGIYLGPSPLLSSSDVRMKGHEELDGIDLGSTFAASLGFGDATDAGDTESEGGDTESAGYNSESDVGQPSLEVGGRRRTTRRITHRE